MESDTSQQKPQINNSTPKINHKISIAPMMAVTNHHYRTMMRFITKETVLYTEMIHHDTITHHHIGSEKLLSFDKSQNPIVLQLGGNNPDLLTKIAPIAKKLGYDEINLNCGCPSQKVTDKSFGATLMKDPDLVSKITKQLRDEANIEVTAKCRIGLDEFDQDFLNCYIDKVSSLGGVTHFIVHARIAIMGLSTVQNRQIPPLDYDTVYKLKEKYPDLDFSINGGIKSLDDVEKILNIGSVTGCMIGRAAYENPWLFSDVDRRFYGKENLGLSRKEVVYKYGDYLDEWCENNDKEKDNTPEQNLLKPLTNLFHGERLSSVFKNKLYEKRQMRDDGSVMSIGDHVKRAVDEYEKVKPEVVNKKGGV